MSTSEGPGVGSGSKTIHLRTEGGPNSVMDHRPGFSGVGAVVRFDCCDMVVRSALDPSSTTEGVQILLCNTLL